MAGAAAGAALWTIGASALRAGDAKAGSATDRRGADPRDPVGRAAGRCSPTSRCSTSGKLSADTEPWSASCWTTSTRTSTCSSAELEELGQGPPDPPASVTAADAELSVLRGSAKLASLDSEADCLRLLEQVEALVEGAYYVSMSKFADSSWRARAPRSSRAEAQHCTALAGLLHPGDINKAVPGAFVEGSA